MIEGLTVLGLITARGGSKRLPGKNLRPLAGKPLLEWTIEAARNSAFLDRVIISSDDPAIVAVAKTAGCEAPFLRPRELAQDDTSSADVVSHVLDTLADGPDLLVLLQPTSPLRTGKDIDDAVKLCMSSLARSCMSVVRNNRTTRLPSYALMPDRILAPAPASQADTVVANGAVYVLRVAEFRRSKQFVTERTAGLLMPEDRSVDIDTEADFRRAEQIIADR